MFKFLLEPRMLATAGTLLAWFLATLLVRLVLRRGKLDVNQRLRIRRIFAMLFFVAAALGLWSIWAESVRDMLVALTAFAVAIVIASKELILCIMGWLYKTVGRTYHTGDRIQVGGIRGDVVQAGMLGSILLEVDTETEQSTGRVVVLPHALLLTMPLFNETRGEGFRWLEIPVRLNDPAEVPLAREILERCAQPVQEDVGKSVIRRVDELRENLDVKTRNLTPKVYVSVFEDKPVVTLRIAVPPRKARDIQDRILQEVFREFAKANIRSRPEEAARAGGKD